MQLRLYNTAARAKQPFEPITPGVVRMYCCGPTVYHFAHIGNLRTYVFEDLLRRALEACDYTVKHVVNITDVGHLTSDADSGEDKMEKGARREGKTVWDIADYYAQAFFNDWKALNLLEPTAWPKATGHIAEQIALIQELERKGFTYEVPGDGIYFDTAKFPRYPEFAGLDIEGMQAGARVAMNEGKRSPTDFALWKFSPKHEQRAMEWESPWGKGFPGWHIECSAMSMKYLGETFDIHTGGIDHIPVHHTNEIAQSEAATGKKFVNYWLHGNFLTFKGEKVGKSKGGLYTISELEELGYSPMDYRYMCFLTHYRKALDFSLDSLNVAKTSYNSLKNKIELIEKKLGGIQGKKYLNEFEKAINNDMNIPKAIQVLQALVKDDTISGKSKLEIIEKIDSVFCLKLLEKEKIEIPKEVKDLIEERTIARKNKDWKLSDNLRDKIKGLGFAVDDTSDGMKVRKV